MMLQVVSLLIINTYQEIIQINMMIHLYQFQKMVQLYHGIIKKILLIKQIIIIIIMKVIIIKQLII